MRDALEFEWHGIPSVAVIADALTGPADAMRRLSGMADHPYLVTAFPVGSLDDRAVRARARSHVDEVLALLCDRPAPSAPVAPGPMPAAPPDTTVPRLLTTGDDAEVQTGFRERGWTDGLPVVLPTIARVDALLATVRRDPAEVVVRLDTRDGLDATVEQIAVNAVMAGVVPVHFPYVLAAMDAMGDPAYNLHAHTATMAGASQVMIVRGPRARAAGFRSEDGALGPGWPANNTVGRATRLVIRNLLRSVHGEFDRAGFSHPGRFGWCIAEDDRTPWPLGASGADEVLVYASTWQGSVIDHQQRAVDLLDAIGLGARAACHVNWLHRDVASESSFYAARPFLFVVGAEHAAVLVRDGYESVESLRAAIYERLTGPGVLRPVAVAAPENLRFLYVHATGMQQSWFFAPFQSHALVRRPLA